MEKLGLVNLNLNSVKLFRQWSKCLFIPDTEVGPLKKILYDVYYLACFKGQKQAAQTNSKGLKKVKVYY